MSYVAGFRCDVFVSYAFVDDEAMTGQQPWVTTFANDLKVLLKRTLGARTDDDLKMFFTGHHGALEAGLDLEEELRNNAGSTAAFVAITSPAYVTPNSWTMKELAAFQEAMGATGRVFVIELTPLDNESQYPESIRRLTRMPFWDKRPPRGIPSTMLPGSEAYTQTLIDLSLQISGQLKKMREEAQRKSVSPVAGVQGAAVATGGAGNGPIMLPPLAGQTVYLAQVTDDLNEERNQVRRYLEPFGVEVLPQGIYPQGGDAFRAAVEADMARAKVFVQLLGRTHAMRPPDLEQGYDRAQAEAALQHNVPMLQWLHPDVDMDAVTDAMHLELLSGAVRGTLESFKADIVKRLEKKPEKEKPKQISSDQFIFIDADAADLPIANKLLSEFSSENFTAAVPLLQGEAADVRRDLEENMVECDALLMVYGSASPVWVRAQLKLFRKLQARREQPVKALAIYVGPPEGKPDIGFDMPGCMKLTPEEMSEFISGLYQ